MIRRWSGLKQSNKSPVCGRREGDEKQGAGWGERGEGEGVGWLCAQGHSSSHRYL